MAENHLIELLEKMSLDEKIAQLMQLATPFYKGSSDGGHITGPIADMGINEDTVINSGSILGASGAKEVMNIQKAFLEENPHGIPLLFMADIIHGFKTIFPVPLAMGCSWDLEAAEKSAAIAAKEAAVSGVHVTFAPMVDLVRDPRWGRVMESTGEDPYLNSLFARAFVRGFQGNDLKNSNEHVAACVKHFAAYGAAEGGRDYNTVDMSERTLRETYLPAYKAALDEGCEMVMTSFNIVDGIPATGSKALMRGILRDEWGFDGVLISDWGAVKEMISHGAAEDEAEAALKAIEAGVDIEMMTPCYVKNLKNLISDGEVSVGLIDEAVLRILRLKDKLGLFENPYRGADEEKEKEIVLSESHRGYARQMAAKSCVLLKNDGVLPLDRSKRIALIGPFAENGDILGPWSWHGSREDAITLAKGVKQKIDSSFLLTSQGCGIETGTEQQLKEAIETAKKADIILLALGEKSEMSGEANCRADIRLPIIQLELVMELAKLDKPMAVVLFNGRPLDLDGVIDEANAILEAWYPGTEGGAAIADILFGDENPSGRLSMSFPHSVGQVPVYYNSFNTGRPKMSDQDSYVSKYLDIPNSPRFPFGFGLTYANFHYSDAAISSATLTEDETITISAVVKNNGPIAGEETVQLYIRDISAEIVRPVRELKGFKKVFLEPGQSEKVEFTVTEEMLRYYHANFDYKSDAGKFNAYIGPNSRDGLELEFKLIK
ncbi:glycoside hydrolase family 3 N-terminal domain-containing protein [Bacillus sp. FJAT-27445]|uniref:glycoside hydrolase family 3 N-terminal domain-containing protein n=1 Tax=Bacillus sp. FJAT-27445 TaxID=1679166 RepID=UPI0007435082|nr:glycoside hydrolase family 3 N-terminal domain-containing protein [Bacillus sp. FJAT-27445]